ncbi:MAG: hypothetical protein GX594_14485, partial [Pirellulaceae bacterium]|nr:hypothetical protein [Pirellulaceae bacterium]
SPEQARDPRHADTRSDIYSLGCTLFFMLSGQPPFPDGTMLQKLLQHQSDSPPDIRRFRPDLPDELHQVLGKMMAKDPRRRYATPGELIADLLLMAERSGLRPINPASRIWLTPPPPPAAPFFRRHLPWMMPVASLLCVILLLDRFWSRRDGDPPPQPNQPPAAALAKAPSAEQKVPVPAASVENPADESFPDPFESDKFSFTTEDWQGYFPLPQSGGQTAAEVAAEPKEQSADVAPPAEKTGPSPPDIFEAIGSFWKNRSGTLHIPSPAVAPAAGPNAKQPTILIVSDALGEGNQFSSLAAACAAAKNGDIIELQYNGPREERPMMLSNMQLTIRPGKGFQPVVVFRPDEINPVRYPRSMITLSAGRLTLLDIAVELHVPRDLPADDWTLLETWGGQSLRLERCSLTVRNASDQLMTYHPEVAFIRARPAPDAGLPVEGGQAAAPLASIELLDSVARGEAIFLRVEDLHSVHLLWENGLLATTDALLSAGGGEVPPKPNESLRLELRRLTAVVHGGLCRLSSTPSNPYQLTVQFVCSDDIFITATGVPLIEQEGSDGVAPSRSRVVWNGDRNFYQDVDVFWMVRNSDPDVQPETMSFEAWKSYWGPSRENQPSREPVVWARYPNGNRPLHTHTPADYTLEYPPLNAETVPGCRCERLPPLASDAPLPRQPGIGEIDGIEWERWWRE